MMMKMARESSWGVIFRVLGGNMHEELYFLSVQEWKSTLFGVLLGSLHFGMEIHSQNSGIHSQKSNSNHYFNVKSTIKLEWSKHGNEKVHYFYLTSVKRT